MKQKLLTILLTLMPLMASADAVEINGIYYNLINKTKTAEVARNPNGYQGNIIIPDNVLYEGVNYQVTALVQFAFCVFNFSNDKLKSISLPNTIEHLPKACFLGNSGLETVILPNNLKTIADSVFYDCRSLQSITVPQTLKSIGGSTFSMCSGLQSIHISDLKAWCEIDFNTKGTQHPINPLRYAHHLFLNGEEVKDLIIPEEITCINDYAFQGCDITSVFFHNNIISIGSHSFDSCTKLVNVDIPKNVSSIGSGAFSNCTGLTSIIIPNGVASIEGGTFSDCKSLNSVNIPNSVTSIGIKAFEGCRSLTSLDIPNKVTNIGGYAFSGCSSIMSVTIPNSVTSISEAAFSGCSGLKSLTIGSGVKWIYEQAFASCKELKNVYCLAESVPETQSNAFIDSYIEYSTLHVPAASIEAYKTTSPWSGFGTFTMDGSAFFEMSITADDKGTVIYGTSNISNTSQTFNVKEDSDVTLTITPNNGYRLLSVTVNNEDKTADVNEGELVINNVSGDLTISVQFILDVETVSVTISDVGIATFCSDKDLDFSEVSGLKAYTGAGFNTSTGKLTMLEVTDAPAGTGLIVKGSAGTYVIPAKTSTSIYANLLEGVTSATELSQTTDGYTNYLLSNGASGLGFYKVSSSGGTLAAGKAYLRIPTTAASARKIVTIDFDDNTTGITDINMNDQDNDNWFDLQGRILKATPEKAGIYIRNGKKMLVK